MEMTRKPPMTATGDMATSDSRFLRFRVAPRMPNFGAWVEGVDLARDVPPEVQRELRVAWLHYGVLFFRGQSKLTPQQHVALSHVFGAGPYAGNPQFERHKEDPHVELLVSDANRVANSDQWHTDLSYYDPAPLGTIIQIQEKPPVGGNTAWACMRKAYEWLSPPMRACLDELVAVHAHVNHRRLSWANLTEPTVLIDILRNDPPVKHPVVMRHPITGAGALYVNELFTRDICDMHPVESAALLAMLHRWSRLPEFQLHHEWQKNDIAVWDNYRTQHYALYDYFPAYRVNQRVTTRMFEDLALLRADMNAIG